MNYQEVLDRAEHVREYMVTLTREELTPFLKQLGTDPRVEFVYKLVRADNYRDEFTLIFRVGVNAW